MRWFLLGIAFGAIVAMIARGEGTATLHDMREWCAGTLRSMEHRPREATAAAPVPGVASPPAATIAPRRPKETPCPVDPAPADPCAALLSPFRASGTSSVASMSSPTIPVVAVENLPRAKPPAIARRHARVVKIAPAPTPAPAPSNDDADDADSDAAANPPPPARTPRHDELTPPEASTSSAPLQTASNDAR